MQEAQPLGCNLDVGNIDAGRVAAWPGNQSLNAVSNALAGSYNLVVR